jgi:hypothetical protein
VVVVEDVHAAAIRATVENAITGQVRTARSSHETRMPGDCQGRHWGDAPYLNVLAARIPHRGTMIRYRN